MIRVLTSSPVRALGSESLIYAAPVPMPLTPPTILINFYNANVAAREITITRVGAKTQRFTIDPSTAESAQVEVTGDVTVTASGTGVSGWVARRS